MSAKRRSRRARSTGARAAHFSWAAAARRTAASTSSGEVTGTVATVSSVAGLMMSSSCGTGSPYMRSKERKRSQSVTAAS